MNVKCAREQIEKINKTYEEMNAFDEKHKELMNETGFICDIAGFLSDYRKVLERAIERAELDI